MINGIHMKPSRVLKKMREGGVAVCAKLNFADSRAFEIAAMAGFDCLWTDMEHVANDWQAVEKQILVSKAYGCDIVVRTSRGGYNSYIKPLELDATGIMVPHIMNAEDARDIVKMTRFHPIGRRPVDGGNADGAYCNIDFKEYIKQANNERFVIVQIEDPEPMEELDEIASIEGIDMLFFGPGDYSQGIGVPGCFDDPRIDDARKRVVQAAKKTGKFAGTVGSVDNFKELAEMGYNFINVAADVIGLSEYFAGAAKRIGVGISLNVETEKIY